MTPTTKTQDPIAHNITPVEAMMTFGDARGLILQIMQQMRTKEITAAEGMAQLAGMKALHDSMNAEIARHKLCIATEGKAYSFGKAVEMGRARLV